MDEATVFISGRKDRGLQWQAMQNVSGLRGSMAPEAGMLRAVESGAHSEGLERR